MILPHLDVRRLPARRSSLDFSPDTSAKAFQAIAKTIRHRLRPGTISLTFTA